MDWFSDLWAAFTWNRILFGGGLFVVTLALNFFVIFLVIIKIPAEYFSPNYTHNFLPGKAWYVRWSAVILKNVVGLVLLIAGIVMLIGPGQGILTILLGLDYARHSGQTSARSPDHQTSDGARRDQ